MVNNGAGILVLPDVRSLPVGTYRIEKLEVGGPSGTTVVDGVIGDVQVVEHANVLPTVDIALTSVPIYFDGTIRDLSGMLDFVCFNATDLEDGVLAGRTRTRASTASTAERGSLGAFSGRGSGSMLPIRAGCRSR